MREGERKPSGTKRSSRQARLEAELRENLRKRKEQARARAQTVQPHDPDNSSKDAD